MSSNLTNQFNNAFTLFLSLLVEAIPFLLLGVLLSSLILWLIDEKKLMATIPKNPFLGALCGGLFGFLFPVCECGNVPVARRLLMQGIPPSVAISFLLAAPTLNPIVIWSTWTAFRDQPEIVIFRVIFSLVIAVIIGCLFSVQTDMRPLLQPALARFIQPQINPISPLLQSGTFMLGGGEAVRLESLAVQAPPKKSKLWSVKAGRFIVNNMVQEFRELGAVLVIGSAIAALIQVAAPREWILGLGQGPISSIIAMLILASVVSICSTVDSFFALSFASAFTSGSLLAFLVFGPMIDIKGIGLMLSIFKGRTVLYLMVLAAQLTFIFSLAVNLYWG